MRMATKICFTGKFKETCEYGRKGNLWKSGYHGGTDLVGLDSDNVYSICNGTVERAGYDNGGFGNYVRIKEDGTENRIYLAHLSKIYVKVGQSVTYTTVVGLMGETGNATGKHTHVEIREFQNGVAVRKLNASNYMGIPNKVGTYDSSNYQIKILDGGEEEMKRYKNGSTVEDVFADTNCTNKIGSLNPREECDCFGIFNNRAMVRYKVDGTNNYKIGFCKWTGGVQ